jgi:serine/threonine protein kinase
MSTVYLARDERLGRDVALKVLFPHLAEDRKVVDRFEQEARNSALISHPNVVQVLDQGQTRETAYLVMEYVPGATLRTLLKKGPMTPRLALTYMDAILLGLGAAHRAGLVHRDIKPENVLVSTDGRIKIADFGLARAATHHSGTSTLMGTVAYISPELLSGEGADERADIYAIGILLYEMLTGVQPYTGDSPVRVAFQHVNSTVPAPSDAVDGLPAALDDIVRLATSGDVGTRPKNADELLALVHSTGDGLTAEELDFDGAVLKGQRDSAGGPTATAVVPRADEAEDSTEKGERTAAFDPDLGATSSTAMYDAAFPEDEDSPRGQEAPAGMSPSDTAPGPQATKAFTPAEDFPTRDESGEWDDDVADALGHAQWASATRTLDEGDRQTVAEVPTEAFRPIDPADHEDREPSAPHQTESMSYAAPWDADHWSHEPPADTGQFSASSTRQSPAPARLESPSSAQSPAGAHQGSARPARSGKPSRQRPAVALETLTPQRTALIIAIVMIVAALVILLAWYIGLNPALIPSLGSAAAPLSGAGTAWTTVVS